MCEKCREADARIISENLPTLRSSADFHRACAQAHSHGPCEGSLEVGFELVDFNFANLSHGLKRTVMTRAKCVICEDAEILRQYGIEATAIEPISEIDHQSACERANSDHPDRASDPIPSQSSLGHLSDWALAALEEICRRDAVSRKGSEMIGDDEPSDEQEKERDEHEDPES